ncbi:MAG: hypothetical protein HOK58_06360 [Acidimicrobiaceae bacterium]|nr:hypothetical protein [Acidimicrobiaceae bacterium]
MLLVLASCASTQTGFAPAESTFESGGLSREPSLPGSSHPGASHPGFSRTGSSRTGLDPSASDRAGSPAGLAAVVDRVIDGDTILVSMNGHIETVRLLGIDTPEKAGGPRPAECFGAEASTRLAELLPPGTSVLLSRDRETRDQYSRLLAFVHRADNDMFVNLAMVEDGFATPLFFAPNRSAESLFTAAGDAARRNWIGFWPACGAADVVIVPEQ